MSAFAFMLRREVWEHRSFYVTPLAVGAVMLLSVIIMVSHMSGFISEVGGISQHIPPGKPITLFLPITSICMSLAFFAVSFLVMAFYLMDTLYAERNDRSILFWKSLPVSGQKPTSLI